MSHVHTKRLPTATPSISRAFLRYTRNEFLVIIIMGVLLRGQTILQHAILK